jgi:choline dehydrogenase
MFDYIVVGAGSAGCAVAGRLSEDTSKKVLLLEAGPRDSNPMIHMPGGCAEVLKSKTLNWQFYSEPQKNLNNRRIYVPRGRMLGGSSGANGMVYIRGHASDYDDWEKAGNPGWAFKDVLPYFRAMEDNVRGANDFHGAGGPLYVNDAPTPNILYDKFIAAGAEIGIPPTDDFNGAQQEGMGRFQCTIKDGKRCSSAVAFLRPALGRPNLTVVTGAHVKRLILKGDQVTGVEYLRGKSVQTAELNNNGEVILSAGAIQNPQILQLSGIGHPDDLAAVGIKTQIALPGVGHNLQEHLDVVMHFAATQPITMNGITNSLVGQAKVALQYLFTKTGVAAGNGIEAGGFCRSDKSLTRPDIQLHFVPAYMTSLIEKLPKQHGVTVHACKLRPESTGTVTVRSDNPLDAPKIDFNFLDKESDFVTLRKCFSILRELMAAKAWDGLIGDEITPGKQVQSADDIDNAIRNITDSVYHPTSTCKMGNGDDAVVNHQLKVHKVQGLRVADASIMPNLIGGNTNVPAMMIGWKCAEMIKQGQ